MARHIVLTVLLVNALGKEYVHSCRRSNHKTYSSLDCRWVLVSTSKFYFYDLHKMNLLPF